jgi:hypothetical protein
MALTEFSRQVFVESLSNAERQRGYRQRKLRLSKLQPSGGNFDTARQIRNCEQPALLHVHFDFGRDCRKRCVRLRGECSGDLAPASPPGEKATASQDQAGQASTGDGAGNWNERDIIKRDERESTITVKRLRIEGQNVRAGADNRVATGNRGRYRPIWIGAAHIVGIQIKRGIVPVYKQNLTMDARTRARVREGESQELARRVRNCL